MNYGKFFRLNWESSHLERGVAVFDYTGLTAYDGSTDRYPMTPKYPVSLEFSSTSVRFLLHYSAFRAKEGKDDRYDFEISDIGQSSKEVSIAHMEEVIIELPFAGKGSENLSSIIKRLYESIFPYNVEGYGSRFLFERIKAAEENERDCRIHAYSSLKSMGSEGEWKPISLRDKNDQYTGFLRKLMLDFMYDFQHSDVFQNSGFFHAMYTGLMSNFYFSALLHKCEFFFYRQLLWDERSGLAVKGKRRQIDNRKNKDKKKQEENKENLYLYYKKEAESLWVKDITSQQAEFEFNYDSKKAEWFADPEAEMHKVCFPLQEQVKKEDRKVWKSMGPEREHRVSISQWLMNRYDFKDLYQFHAPARFLWIPIVSWPPVNVVFLAIGIILMFMILIPSIVPIEYPVYGIIAIIVAIFVAVVYKIFSGAKVSNHLHLFYPRLIAAIATAWMTLALGFDLMVSFFDYTISFLPLAFILVVLFFFVLAKIKQVTPRLGFWKKAFWRSVELIVIGYCISFAIGVVMVNFLGERFMERGDYIRDFYAQLDDNRNLDYRGDEDLKMLVYCNDRKELPNTALRQMTRELEKVYQKKCNYPIAKRVEIIVGDIYYLRDFTVLFSFIALFVGIFIELIILGDRRQMTEL